MATLAHVGSARGGDTRFFAVSAYLMALVVVAGFSVHLAMGRSSFDAPLLVHLHALTFFGWTVLFVLQAALVDTGAVRLHRRLGWLAAAFLPAMLVLGLAVTVAMVRRGGVPFFFEPLYFLVMDPVILLTFAGLAGAAIINRRRTDWHRRLMLCAMAMLIAPAFGRLLPLPFVMPYAGWVVFAALMLFPLAGVVADLRRRGRVHPAWVWGIATLVVAQASIDLIARGPLGMPLYAAVVAGSPGATIDPLAFPPAPPL